MALLTLMSGAAKLNGPGVVAETHAPQPPPRTIRGGGCSPMPLLAVGGERGQAVAVRLMRAAAVRNVTKQHNKTVVIMIPHHKKDDKQIQNLHKEQTDVQLGNKKGRQIPCLRSPMAKNAHTRSQ